MSSAENIQPNSNKASIPSEEITAEKKSSWGRSFCSVSKCTLLFSAALIISSIALFVLQALYGFPFHQGAIATISVGTVLFFLGLIANCVASKSTSQAAKKADAVPKTESPSTIASTPTLPAEVGTKEFFESRGIFGLPQELIDEIDIWRKYRTNENFDLSLDAGFIFYGPPGTGKTTIAQCIHELLGGQYVEKKSCDMNSRYFGETEGKISELFDVPEEEFRVVVIDEIDGFLPVRDGLSVQDRITTHFLSVVSGTRQTKPRYILIGTTNNYEGLDKALVRRGRLGKIFKIENPDRETRIKIFHHHLGKLKLSEDEDWTGFAEQLADRTENASCADIVGIVSDAQKKAILGDRLITKEDFLK